MNTLTTSAEPSAHQRPAEGTNEVSKVESKSILEVLSAQKEFSKGVIDL